MSNAPSAILPNNIFLRCGDKGGALDIIVRIIVEIKYWRIVLDLPKTHDRISQGWA
jgi:hypothetical protein